MDMITFIDGELKIHHEMTDNDRQAIIDFGNACKQTEQARIIGTLMNSPWSTDAEHIAALIRFDHTPPTFEQLKALEDED